MRTNGCSKCRSTCRHIWNGWYTLINPRAFGRLPKDMQDLVMDSFNQAGIGERNDIAGLIDKTKVFLAEKGMIVSTPPDLAPFRQKLKQGGLYKERQERWDPKAGRCCRRSAARCPDPSAAAILKVVSLDATSSPRPAAVHSAVAAMALAIERPAHALT